LVSVLSTGMVEAFAPVTPSRTTTTMTTRTTTPVAFPVLRLTAEAAEDEDADFVIVSSPVTSGDNDNDNEVTKKTTTKPDLALLFDCDGVILETEELHRRAYNAAFLEAGVTKVCGDSSEIVEWSVGYYDILQNSIGGGKPKMRHFFSQVLRFESNEHGDPTTIVANTSVGGGDESEPSKKKKRKGKKNKKSEASSSSITVTPQDIDTKLESLIDALQTRKTELYKTTVEETATPRPGLLDLMDEALADETIAVGVCSASTKEAAQKVLECTLGADRVARLDVCILGDDVSEKKPSPMIYNEARSKLGIALPTRCVVVEDSAVGLRAAKAAGMRCLITYTASTTAEDFYGMGADAKVPDLANNGNPVTLGAIFGPLREAFASAGNESDGDNNDGDRYPELLVGTKDEAPAVVVEDDDLPFEIEIIRDEPAAEAATTATTTTTLEPTADEAEAFAASEDDVAAGSLDGPSATGGDADVLPVTLSPSPEEKAFFESAGAEVDAADLLDSLDAQIEAALLDGPVTAEPVAEESSGSEADAKAPTENPATFGSEESATEETAPVVAEEAAVEEPVPVEEEPAGESATVVAEEEAVEKPAPVEEEPAEDPAPVVAEEEPVEEPVPVEEESAEESAPVVAEEPTPEASPERVAAVPETPAATAFVPKQIRRARMVQDDMGNFSM